MFGGKKMTEQKQQAKKIEWTEFFNRIVELHPAPTILMLKVDVGGSVSLIAAASTVEAMAVTLEKTKPPIYIG